MTADELSRLRGLAEKATPGPWKWSGTLADVRLDSMVSGRPIVMAFRRRGMNQAQPAFAVGRNNADPAWSGMLETAAEGSLDSPDARWIAAANPSVVLALIDAVEALTEERRHYQDEAMGLQARLTWDQGEVEQMTLQRDAWNEMHAAAVDQSDGYFETVMEQRSEVERLRSLLRRCVEANGGGGETAWCPLCDDDSHHTDSCPWPEVVEEAGRS